MPSAAKQYTTYPIKNLFFLLLFANQELLQPTHSFLPNNSNIVRFSQYKHSTSTTTFAGFGASSTKKNKKSKKKRKGGLLSDDLNLKPIKSNENEAQKQPEVELDRFGLPVRNAENFFSPLPEGTELKGYDATNTKLVDIEEAMGKHIQLNYDIFDEGGVEKIDVENTNANTNANGKPWKMRLLHKSPPVLEIQNFFTEEECAEYMSISDPPDSDFNSDSQSQSPLMVNSATFSSLAQSKRTSTTWFCHYSQVPALLAKAKRLLNDLPLRQMEEAQIVRYRTGEEFSWHYDEIPKAQLENGGQRIATLLVYLNTNSKGGGTIFRDLKDNSHADDTDAADTDADAADGVLTMRPKTGSALLFFPAFLDGTPDDRTLHKGEVAVEKKMIAQMWIHERDYKPVIPEGNSHEAALEAIERKERELGYRV